MKSLILDGRSELDNSEIQKLHDIILKELKKNQCYVNDIPLREKNIAPCQGCFDCWVKTPGICKIDDYGRIIAEQIVKSDLVIHLTPITFGGYSSELKKAMDRTISLVLPFFKVVDGEIHHKQRYSTHPCLIVIGYQNSPHLEFEETFHTLVHRNVLNMEAAFYKSLVVNNKQDLSKFQADFQNCLEEVKYHNK
ncbi:MAG: flavodoxin family protein [Promethearchaeota archaeon]|nr:MAG: flavodoxin family protein [Candidatus Lokiarchaeota archaeon]